jgi:hypothetical protein
VAFGGSLRTCQAVKLLNLVIPVIERIREMRSSAAGFSTTNWTIVDYDYGPPGACQQVCRGHSGNARAYNADTRTRIARELRQLWRITGGHPD